MANRIEIVSEEPDFAACADSYMLKLKQVKDFVPTGRKGWMGAVYFRGIDDSPDFTANTDMHPSREEALEDGIDTMLNLQVELDEAVDSSNPPLRFSQKIVNKMRHLLFLAAHHLSLRTDTTEGVPQSAWSQVDQQRMSKGQKPLGHPEHPNV